MPKSQVDYSIYYVTGRTQLPPAPASYTGHSEDWYLHHLELALQGGVTIVQIREKDVDGREYYEIARRSKEVCDKVRLSFSLSDVEVGLEREEKVKELLTDSNITWM